MDDAGCGNGTSDRMATLIAQFQAVRREIDLRIAIQSAIVTTVATGVFVSSVLTVFAPAAGMAIAVGFALATFLLSLHWMHNDVRHLELGRYLAQEIEPRLSSGAAGWERFHADRPRDPCREWSP